MNSNQKSTTRKIAKLSAMATAALLAAPIAAAPAHASGGGRQVAASNGCATGVIKVKAKADDGAIEVEGEVDTNRRGQTWAWSIRRDGVRTSHGTRTTAGASGSFSVERRIANTAGPNRIVFRAVRGTQVCSVGVTF